METVPMVEAMDGVVIAMSATPNDSAAEHNLVGHPSLKPNANTMTATKSISATNQERNVKAKQLVEKIQTQKQLDLAMTDDSLPKRETWSNHLDFMLSMVGSCVGLGNVWRFPYLCYKNGGGAFLVPYVLTVVCAGVPMFLLEVSLGQFYSKGPIDAWQASPPFKGIGIGGTVMCFIVNIYYIVVVSWIGLYLWNSLTLNLPWSSCDNIWNQKSCVLVSKLPRVLCTSDPYNYNLMADQLRQSNVTLPYIEEVLRDDLSSSQVEIVSPAAMDFHLNINQPVFPAMNLSTVFHYSDMTATSDFHCLIKNNWIHKDNITEPVREFWERKVLKTSSGLDDVGSLNPDMTMALLVCWLICYFCIWKGIRWTGKVVYVTALLPYLLLLVLLVHTLQLPGAFTGLRYFIVPDVAKLMQFDVWLAAVSQVFYSYALAYGFLVTFGSYNKFSSNCYRDCIFISIVNSCTSLLAGVIVFSIVGFMSQTQNKPVEEVALSGPGLAFLVFPAAAQEMPLSSLWSAIFFFTLFMIGLDSEFCFVESVITALTDQFPRQLRPRKEMFTAAVCLTSCLLGLTCVTEGGIYVFQLLDNYACGGICLVWFVFWSSVAIGWGYGADRWIISIQAMIGYHPGRWWPFCWKYIVPAITSVVFAVNVVMWKPLTYVDYKYTTVGNAIGWILALTSMTWVPGYFIYYVITAKKSGTFKQRLISVFRPDVFDEEPITAI